MMPGGLLRTVPLRVPVLVTVKTNPALKVAPTDLLAVIATEHLPTPRQAPVQPTNAAPVAGVAVSCTTDPSVKLAVHAVPQSIPVGLLVTVPLLVPAFVIVKLTRAMKLAVSDVAALTVTEHVDAAPVQAPPQPANTAAVAGVAVNVITVPGAKPAAHTLGQLIPGGLLVSVPGPATVTVRGKLVAPATNRYGVMLPVNGATDFARIPAVVSLESVANP